MYNNYTGISVEVKDSIGYVFFDNIENQNRVGYKETGSLMQALLDVDADENVRVIILSGKGDYFCSGGKIDGFPDGSILVQQEYADIGVRALHTIFNLSKPIIAAVNATSLAGGLMFTEACDLAVTGKSCMFGLPEIQRGYFPMVALAMLQKAMPKKLLFEMAFTGKLVDAKTMVDWHLINEAVDDSMVMARAEELARVMLQYSPMPLSFGRRCYYGMVDMSLSSSLNYSERALLNLIWTEDVRETAHAAEEGRAPVYKGR